MACFSMNAAAIRVTRTTPAWRWKYHQAVSTPWRVLLPYIPIPMAAWRLSNGSTSIFIA